MVECSMYEWRREISGSDGLIRHATSFNCQKICLKVCSIGVEPSQSVGDALDPCQVRHAAASFYEKDWSPMQTIWKPRWDLLDLRQSQIIGAELCDSYTQPSKEDLGLGKRTVECFDPQREEKGKASAALCIGSLASWWSFSWRRVTMYFECSSIST